MPRRLLPIRAAAWLLLPITCATMPIRADAPQDPRELVRWLASSERKWDDLPEIASHLDDDAIVIRTNALMALMDIWKANRKLPKQLGTLFPSAYHIVQSLGERYTILPVGYRRYALEMAMSFGADRLEAVPLLIRALADESPGIQGMVKPMADRAFANVAKERFEIEALVRFAEQAGPSGLYGQIVRSRIDAGGIVAHTAAVDIALYDLAAGQDGAGPLLKSWHAEDSALARLAGRVTERTGYEQEQLRSLYEALQISADAAMKRAAELLAKGDAQIRSDTAAFIAADPDRFSPLRLLQVALNSGIPITSESFASLKLDLATACDHIAKTLNSPRTLPGARITAVQTVRLIGLHGDAIRPALERLLEDPDDDVCYIAAEMLGRRDVWVRARIPGLLKELRSEIPSRRLTAAIQLETLEAEPREITAALRRAVAQGNMPAREGLIRAIERAYANHTDSLDKLRELAVLPKSETDPTSAYARAALQEVRSAP